MFGNNPNIKKKNIFRKKLRAERRKGMHALLQSLLSSTLLLKYIRIQTYRKINLPVV